MTRKWFVSFLVVLVLSAAYGELDRQDIRMTQEFENAIYFD